MSFKKKQLLGFGMILILLTFLLTILVYSLNTMKSNMTEIVKDRYVKVQLAMEVRQLFSQSDREILFAANEANKKEAEESIQTINENQRVIEEDIAQLSSIINTQQADKLLKEFETQYTTYGITQSAIIQSIQSNEESGDLSALMNEQKDKRTKVIEALENFKDYQENIMNETLADSEKSYSNLMLFTAITVLFSIVIISAIILWMMRSTSRDLRSITGVIQNIDYSDLTELPRIKVRTEDEIGEIAKSFNEMASSLETYSRKEREFTTKISEQNWIQTRLADIATMYQRIVDMEVLADRFMTRLAPMIGATYGAFYVRRGTGKDSRFVKLADFAGEGDGAGRREFKMGEGMIGQAALEKRSQIIHDIPDEYQLVTTGLGEVKPKSILMAPVVFEDEVVAMVELASLKPFTDLEQTFLARVLETLGITINNVEGRMEIERLLKESQAQTEELQAQSEELQSQSEEMQAQSEELQTQAEELRMINEQLEERNREAEEKSRLLQEAKSNLEQQAEELKLSSKYKSEFMANMSHELRTPLNSILILSEMLSDSEDSQLTEEQQEFARVINSSGQDLLNLINDILDLSKVEVGKLEVSFDEMNLSTVPDQLHRNFDHVAKKKGIEFKVVKDPAVPDIIFTDEQRFQQILKNLLSNAFKFTEEGSVKVSVKKAEEEYVAQWINTELSDTWLEIKVSDTGIGISKEKQKIIFEAFQQGDGATVRKYGGTGLGLSICREFAKLLGGWVVVDSEEGKGSTFTFFVPSLPNGQQQAIDQSLGAIPEVAASQNEPETLEDPEEEILAAEEEEQSSNPFCKKKVLVVDDDHRNIYALEKALKQEGMQIITAKDGFECLEIMEQENDIDAVLMDIMMPGMDGYETMTRIRREPRFEELPIIALTAKAMKGDREKCLKAGASDYVSKPLKIDQLLSVLRVWLTN
ncbi:response regulator [Bacillus massiliglaciei]|uniref:response regulator n=1 Tax=Bacillus massiliglaciei TaxID=1816693 RepID=UPI000B00836D|nr:response regulator [Bacillus massiliglaciei]